MTPVAHQVKAGCLTHSAIRARFEIGWYEGFDGEPWLATDAEVAQEPAANTQWAVPYVVTGNADGVVFDVAACVFALSADTPIVLREVV